MLNPLYRAYYPRQDWLCSTDVNGVLPGGTGYIPTINYNFNPMFTFCGKYAYDPAALTCVTSSTSYQACPSPGALPIAVNAAVSGVALCGTLAGQLVWCALARPPARLDRGSFSPGLFNRIRAGLARSTSLARV